jgi:hypothetical protein
LPRPHFATSTPRFGSLVPLGRARAGEAAERLRGCATHATSRSAAGTARGQASTSSSGSRPRRQQAQRRLALNLVGLLVKNRFYADNGIDYATQQCIEGFGAIDLPQEIAGTSRARWPALGHAALPAQRLGAHAVPDAAAAGKGATEVLRRAREFDPLHVGFVTRPTRMAMPMASGWTPASRAITTPARLLGGCGHVEKHLEEPQANPLPHGVIGPEFTDEQRYDIVEYLKIHRDLPETPPDYRPPACQLRGKAP